MSPGKDQGSRTALDERTVSRIRATEADVLLGVVVLDDWRQEGDERAAAELQRIVRSLEPSEFSAGYSALWCAVRKLHAAGDAITLESLIETGSAWWPREALERSLQTALDSGMPLGWSARDAARRLLAVADARQRYIRAREEGTAALQEIRGAVRELVV